MAVTERLMKAGGFEVAFREDTPASILSIFNEGDSVTDVDCAFLGHVFITPTRLPPAQQTDTQLLASARYTGVMRRRLRRGIRGVGLGYYLGDDNGIGPTYIFTERRNQGFSAWINTLIFTTSDSTLGTPYLSGTTTNIGADTVEFEPMGLNRREALDFVCNFFGGEYRINPNNTFDAGTAANLFVTTPTAIALPKGGPIDIDVEGLRALQLELEVDYEDFWNYSALLIADGTFTSAASSGLTPKDLRGGDIIMYKRFNAPEYTAVADATDAAVLARDEGMVPRRAIRLQAGRYDVTGKVHAGDTLYVYDPENFIFDLANPLAYGGRTIYPMKLRALAVTWPIQRGMGVYFRNSDNSIANPHHLEITDLSDWVAYEEGGADLEVGAEKRALTKLEPTSTPIVRALAPEWHAPTLLNSWVDFGSGYSTAAYRRVGDRVELRGLVTGGAIGTVIFTLPTGFQPPLNAVFPIVTNNLFGRVSVQSNGDVILDNIGNPTGFVALDVIAFSVT